MLALVAVAAAAFVAVVLLFARAHARRDDDPFGDEFEPDLDDVEEIEEELEAAQDQAARTGALVLLENNRWEECAFDGVREDWKRYAGEAVRGFTGVPAGRHQASTRTARGQAVVDFVVYPGEIFVRRLEAGARRWAEPDRAAQQHIRERARGGSWGVLDSALVSYRATFSATRAQNGLRLRAPRAATREASVRLAALLERASAGDDLEQLVREARGVGHRLIGVPLTREQLRTLTSLVEQRIEAPIELVRRSIFVRIALTVLPEDPYLLERLGAMLHDEGRNAEALEVVERALRREGALDDDAQCRARATQARILSAEGRTDEARAIIDAVARQRPSDPYAQRVRRSVYEKVAN
jgi:hypothetical protein